MAELGSPHLSKIDKADALIASIAATDILLNELGLEDAPLRQLIEQLRNRRLGTPDAFSFDQAKRPNAIGFDGVGPGLAGLVPRQTGEAPAYCPA